MHSARRFTHKSCWRLIAGAAISMMIIIAPAMAAAPTFIKIFPGDGVITLAWQRTSASGSYKVYRSTTAGDATAPELASVSPTRPLPCMENCSGPAQDGTSDCGDKLSDLLLVDMADSTVENGTTYYYRISSGSESDRSDEVSATPSAVSGGITKNRFLKIMPLGNSITAGYVGNCTEFGSYRDSLSHLLKNNEYQFAFVGANLNTSRPANGEYMEQPCHEGWHERMVMNIYKTVIDYTMPVYKPDIVLLEIGTNECVFFSEYLPQAPAYFDSLVTRIHEMLPATHIIVTPVPAYGTDTVGDWGKQLNTQINNYNADLKAIVQEKNSAGRNISWLAEMDSFVWTIEDFAAADIVHPSMLAHHKIAGIWYRAIDALAGTTAMHRAPASHRFAAPAILAGRDRITVTTAEGGPVTVAVYSFQGRRISSAFAESHNGTEAISLAIRPGMYVVTARAAGFAEAINTVNVR